MKKMTTPYSGHLPTTDNNIGLTGVRYIEAALYNKITHEFFSISWTTMHCACCLEIKVHYLDITAFLCCFLFGLSLISARNHIQMAPARLNCLLLHSAHPGFKSKFDTRMNAEEPTVQTPFGAIGI